MHTLSHIPYLPAGGAHGLGHGTTSLNIYGSPSSFFSLSVPFLLATVLLQDSKPRRLVFLLSCTHGLLSHSTLLLLFIHHIFSSWRAQNNSWIWLKAMTTLDSLIMLRLGGIRLVDMDSSRMLDILICNHFNTHWKTTLTFLCKQHLNTL